MDRKELLRKFKNEEYFINTIDDYCNKLILKGYVINDNSFSSFIIFENEERLKKVLNNNLQCIDLFEKKGKDKKSIQTFLDTNYYIFVELLPSYLKDNDDYLRVITEKYNNSAMNIRNKMLLEAMNLPRIADENLDTKKKILFLCLKDVSILENEKMITIVKALPMNKLFSLQKNLNNVKEKHNYGIIITKLINALGKENLINNNKIRLYNDELYRMIEDERLSVKKIEIIKHAYFQNGIDLDAFKRDLGNELYTCDAGQLNNYVICYTKYIDGYLTKDEYEFSKRVIEDYQLPQEEIEKDVLPVIEKYDLTKRQIKDCISIGASRNIGDTKKCLDLCITAKEVGFSDYQINELLDNASVEETSYIIDKKNEILEMQKYDKKEIKNVLDEGLEC